MRTRIHIAVPLVALSLAAAGVAFGQHDHSHGDNVGKVEFPNSCSPAVQDQFLRGVAMLHSFYYSAAQKAFEEVAAEDNACAIAAWGYASILMARTPFTGVLVLFLVAFQIVPVGHLRAQVPGTAEHEHLTEVACVDVPPGEERPEFGCFNIGVVTGLHFSQASVYWHLRAFPSRKAAEAVKSATGIVVEEDGRVWLSEFGPRNTAPRGGEAIAIVGPLQLPAAKSYAAVLSYAVMIREGEVSRARAEEIARMVMRTNAGKLYKLGLN